MTQGSPAGGELVPLIDSPRPTAGPRRKTLPLYEAMRRASRSAPPSEAGKRH